MATYWINADSGDDVGGSGTEGDPWETLAHAYSNSGSGDTIICQDATATYDWLAATMSNRTIEGEQDDASGAVFDAGGGQETWRLSGTFTIQYITFQNFTGTLPSGWNCIRVHTSEIALTLNNCLFRNIEIAMADVALGGFITVYIVANVCTIDINRCAFHVARLAGETGNPRFLSLSSSPPNHVVNIYNSAIYMENVDFTSLYSAGLIIDHRNSIYYGNSCTWKTGPSGYSQTISYCCCHNITGSPSGTGVITSDPLFIDLDNANFRLRPDSPCIDTGTLV